jgi:hypothetical protein
MLVCRRAIYMSNRTFTITLESVISKRSEANLDELEEIIPVIEAAQFAIREGARK